MPEHLSDPVSSGADVRITCGHCGFEEDWTPAALARHLAEIGGSQRWAELTRHLRCRRFGCGATTLDAVPLPPGSRPANMPRRIGRLDAHLLSAALAVLEGVTQRSHGQAVATLEVRLALLVVHRYARDRDCVRRFWLRAADGNRTVDAGLAEPLQLIRHRLVAAGWLAPPVLLEPARTWPWDSPAPPGWKAPAAVATRPDEQA
ncbi:hypothetical protein OMW55_00090 [Sphingomonas sp. BN140010]|uniref:Transposase n=1 Tax=Sphingomonas arvum TaxID=2992113 RepID=A0ABT3JAW7_9SPHN|nr:hypothetical protein [Sphingomonas sp. BN140010]MCW3796209.1 hypothetical protein [Sphingomonas sp. BN140010]